MKNNISDTATGGTSSGKPRTKRETKEQIVYSAPEANAMAAAEEPLEYLVRCPRCDRRVFDISELPPNLIRVRLKCPHCHKIVEIPCAAYLLSNRINSDKNH
jgi:endogenous inhibitor of DNA gyrase (YacG/DUF329 family)